MPQIRKEIATFRDVPQFFVGDVPGPWDADYYRFAAGALEDHGRHAVHNLASRQNKSMLLQYLFGLQVGHADGDSIKTRLAQITPGPESSQEAAPIKHRIKAADRIQRRFRMGSQICVLARGQAQISLTF